MLVRQVADEDDIKDMQQVRSSPPASMCMPPRPFIAIWSSAFSTCREVVHSALRESREHCCPSIFD
jgi:hypothetical protein